MYAFLRPDKGVYVDDLVRTPLDGDSPTNQQSGLNGPGGLVVNEDDFYWGDDSGSIWTAPVDGGPATTIVSSAMLGGSAYIGFFDGSTLYYVADVGTGVNMAQSEIHSLTLGVGGADTVIYFPLRGASAISCTRGRTSATNSTTTHRVQFDVPPSTLRMPCAGRRWRSRD